MKNFGKKTLWSLFSVLVLGLSGSVVWGAYGSDVSFDGTEGSATKATFNADRTYRSNKATAYVFSGTEITKRSGGTFDFSQFTLTDLGDEGPNDFAGGFEFGIPGTALNSNKSFNFQVTVDSSWNGRTLSVHLQRPGETGWRKLTVCGVSAGVCSFSSAELGKFVLSDYSKSTYKTGSGDKYEAYLEAKKAYGSKSYRKWYFRMKWLKKNNKARYEQIKANYELYKEHKGDPVYAQYKEDYTTYRKYVKCKEYKSLRKYRNY